VNEVANFRKNVSVLSVQFTGSRLLMDLESLTMKETRSFEMSTKPPKQRHSGISQRTGVLMSSCHSKITINQLQLLVNSGTSFSERFLRDQLISNQTVLVVSKSYLAHSPAVVNHVTDVLDCTSGYHFNFKIAFY